MLRKIEKNAKNKEEALELAAKDFGVPVEELSYKVEREVGKGLMGLLLGKEVVISAWITKEAEEEERKIKEIAKERAHSDEFEAKSENPYAPKAEPIARDYAKSSKAKSVEKKAEVSKTAEVPESEKHAVSEPALDVKAEDEKADKKEDNTSASRKCREVTPKSMEDAEYFAENLIHKMGLTDAELSVVNSGKSIDIDVSGSKMGLLIGKRGDTLDAVQYLTSLFVNKEKNSYIKVNVDTEGYRAKREETLIKLAKSLERRVIREGSAVTLEPMSPNERRIIHSALQNSSKVQTYSVGEEPHRKVVVDLK